jgi:hypothetical protein
MVGSGIVPIAPGDDGADPRQERMLPHLMTTGLMIDAEACSSKICT